MYVVMCTKTHVACRTTLHHDCQGQAWARLGKLRLKSALHLSIIQLHIASEGVLNLNESNRLRPDQYRKQSIMIADSLPAQLTKFHVIWTPLMICKVEQRSC